MFCDKQTVQEWRILVVECKKRKECFQRTFQTEREVHGDEVFGGCGDGIGGVEMVEGCGVERRGCQSQTLLISDLSSGPLLRPPPSLLLPLPPPIPSPPSNLSPHSPPFLAPLSIP